MAISNKILTEHITTLYGIDAGEELEELLDMTVTEWSKEIDAQIIRDLIKLADDMNPLAKAVEQMRKEIKNA